ncbi:hypothetical protein ACGFZK_29080 [Streptomyces sp. NPDC048257]|uniref:hypothetical protein n=1 Tax=Streptomyces sp. NPDC048257 TaxID=3365526 RepID=UPI0037140CFD
MADMDHPGSCVLITAVASLAPLLAYGGVAGVSVPLVIFGIPPGVPLGIPPGIPLGMPSGPDVLDGAGAGEVIAY